MHNDIADVVDSQNQDRRARHKHERIDETEYSVFIVPLVLKEE